MTSYLAHGTGEAAAFPVDITYALVGGSWALAVSFLVLAFAWKTPRLDASKYVAALPRLTHLADSRALREGLGVVGLALTVGALILGFIARDEHENPLVGTFFIWLWVGLVPASLVFGPVGRYLSPVRTLHRWACSALGRRPEQGIARVPGCPGALAGRSWPVRVCVDRARRRRQGLHRRALVVRGVLRDHRRRSGRIRFDVVHPGRTVRGVQRDDCDDEPAGTRRRVR